ncbi:hypothetical protein [Tissierella carlieri]
MTAEMLKSRVGKKVLLVDRLADELYNIMYISGFMRLINDINNLTNMNLR